MTYPPVIHGIILVKAGEWSAIYGKPDTVWTLKTSYREGHLTQYYQSDYGEIVATVYVQLPGDQDG